METKGNKLKDLALYMDPFTGSIDTGENWEKDFETAVRDEDIGWPEDWRDGMVKVDANGQEIEEDLSSVEAWLKRYLAERK